MMAAYFYDYSVGADIARDAAGTVCCDDKAAIRHGWIKLASLLSQHEKILPWQHFELIVRREDGVHVGRMGLTVDVETQNPETSAALASRQGDRLDGQATTKHA